MGDKLRGKNSVVTGAGRGIGREVALALAAEGANVVVVDPGVARDGKGVDYGPVDEVANAIKARGVEAVALHESVADFSAAERIMRSCVDGFGRLDILVNCAGIIRARMIFNMTEEDWDGVINVHLKGTWNCCRHASVLMREQRGGRIMNFTSSNWLGTVGQCNYSAAKGGIYSLTRSLALELGRYGVTCNAIDPTAATRMTLDERAREGLRRRLESGFLAKEQYERALDMPGPEGVAPVVVYLATEEAANINGQVFHASSDRVSIYAHPVEAHVLRKEYKKEGIFTLRELIDMVPKTLLVGYVNPAPPEQAREQK